MSMYPQESSPGIDSLSFQLLDSSTPSIPDGEQSRDSCGLLVASLGDSMNCFSLVATSKLYETLKIRLIVEKIDECKQKL